MPAIIKTTFNFNGQAQGWSESFYWTSTDGNLQTAETLVTPLAQKRAACLASGYTLQVFRNEVIQQPVGTKVLRVSDLAEPGFTSPVAYAPATPNMALLLVWQNATNTKSKKQYMRGIPAGLGDLGKVADFGNTLIAGFYTAFQAWTSAMQNFQAGWLSSSTSGTAIINSYTVDPVTASVTFTLNAGGSLSFPAQMGTPFRVIVSIPNKSPLDGPLTVIQNGALTVFTPAGHPAPPLPTGQLGIMRQQTSALVTLSPVQTGVQNGGIFPQRIISHKTGRPSYASRGRRAATVRW